MGPGPRRGPTVITGSLGPWRMSLEGTGGSFLQARTCLSAPILSLVPSWRLSAASAGQGHIRGSPKGPSSPSHPARQPRPSSRGPGPPYDRWVVASKGHVLSGAAQDASGPGSCGGGGGSQGRCPQHALQAEDVSPEAGAWSPGGGGGGAAGGGGSLCESLPHSCSFFLLLLDLQGLC